MSSNLFISDYSDHAELINPVCSSPTHNKKKKILLADDNADMREYVKSLLHSKKHWEVVDVDNGLEAYEILSSNPAFDLVLSDVMVCI